MKIFNVHSKTGGDVVERICGKAGFEKRGFNWPRR